MRSKTAYSGEEINEMLNAKVGADSKMKDTGEIFAESQNKYGVNALAAASIAANESGWGKSSISQNKNNLFGLNAVDESPGTARIAMQVCRHVLKILQMDGCRKGIYIQKMADTWADSSETKQAELT